MKRSAYYATGLVFGAGALLAMAFLPMPAGAIVALFAWALAGGEVALAWAKRREARGWTAQRCWEILADDANPVELQMRAGARLAELGRGVLAPTEWWPWRVWRSQDAYPFNGWDGVSVGPDGKSRYRPCRPTTCLACGSNQGSTCHLGCPRCRVDDGCTA